MSVCDQDEATDTATSRNILSTQNNFWSTRILIFNRFYFFSMVFERPVPPFLKFHFLYARVTTAHPVFPYINSWRSRSSETILSFARPAPGNIVPTNNNLDTRSSRAPSPPYTHNRSHDTTRVRGRILSLSPDAINSRRARPLLWFYSLHFARVSR